jgi:hypothetical protein
MSVRDVVWAGGTQRRTLGIADACEQTWGLVAEVWRVRGIWSSKLNPYIRMMETHYRGEVI